MIAIREMEDESIDDRIVERNKKMLEQQGWMVVMFSRDFAFWAKVARLFNGHDHPQAPTIPNGQMEE